MYLVQLFTKRDILTTSVVFYVHSRMLYLIDIILPSMFLLPAGTVRSGALSRTAVPLASVKVVVLA